MANTCPFIAPCPHLFRPHKTLQSPKCQGNLPLAALPLCVFGSALSSLQPWQCSPPSCSLSLISWSFPALPGMPAQPFPRRRALQAPQGFFLKLLICHFTEAAEEKASPALFCSHSIPTVQHPLCPQHKLCFCDPSCTQLLPPVSLLMFPCGICWFNNPVGSACSCHLFLFQHKSQISYCFTHRFQRLIGSFKALHWFMVYYICLVDCYHVSMVSN